MGARWTATLGVLVAFAGGARVGGGGTATLGVWAVSGAFAGGAWTGLAWAGWGGVRGCVAKAGWAAGTVSSRGLLAVPRCAAGRPKRFRATIHSSRWPPSETRADHWWRPTGTAVVRFQSLAFAAR